MKKEKLTKKGLLAGAAAVASIALMAVGSAIALEDKRDRQYLESVRKVGV